MVLTFECLQVKALVAIAQRMSISYEESLPIIFAYFTIAFIVLF